MVDEEKLKNEVRELLAGKKPTLRETKNVIEDSNTNQISIKIPKGLALAGQLSKNCEIIIAVNPDETDFEKAFRSHFIIYAKEKEESIK
jgi:hypothetical protein